MKHVRKPIALLLALVLAASLLCLPALAADTVPARYARYRVYTCLGDSNAAGYAAEGYQDQPCTVTPGAYHSMVAGDLGAKLNARGWGRLPQPRDAPSARPGLGNHRLGICR